MRRSTAAYTPRHRTRVGSLAAPEFGPGGEMYTDSKGRAWMLQDVPDGVVGISADAHAQYMAKDRADLMQKIEGTRSAKGYGTLALIGIGIVGALWWFLHETKASSATSNRNQRLHGEPEDYVSEHGHWKLIWADRGEELGFARVAAAHHGPHAIKGGWYLRKVGEDRIVDWVVGPFPTKQQAIDDEHVTRVLHSSIVPPREDRP